MSEHAQVAERLAVVRDRIAAAANRAGRDPGEITLVGVSKRMSASRVVAAVAAGLADVGESYVQEARAKLPEIRAGLEARGLPQPRWHFVGQLQRNKAGFVAESFDCIQSVDRASLARDLDRRCSAAGRTLDVLLQVNLSGEAQKGGVEPDALPDLISACTELGALRVRGLMAVPAAAGDPESRRPAFARLRALRDAAGDPALVDLSMGMSGDLEVAIEEGASMVRVGTAIFGPRETQP